MFEKFQLDVPARFVGRKPAAPRLVSHVHGLAEHVELPLRVRGVADAHRRRLLIAGQPICDPFDQPPFAADAVHDLKLLRAAGDGAQQPFAPGLRLLVIAGMHDGEQRQRGVAQPAVAVIPIALAADPLRQRGGGSGDDAAGRPIGQRFQRDHRAAHRIRPLAGRPAYCRPFGPELFRRLQRRGRVVRFRQSLVRARIGQDERNGLALPDDELADRGHVLALDVHRRAQHRHVGTGDRA